MYTPREFWNLNDGNKDSMFYVSFCLLKSSLEAFAIACDLHYHNKINWAVIAYYYSLVHSLRLLCFLAMGDFPKLHNALIRLYKNGSVEDTPSWCASFIPKVINSRNRRFELSEITNMIFDMNRVNSSEIEAQFNQWGSILDSASKCRNYSNYEGLISAQQEFHIVVTEEFDKLTSLLNKAVERILPPIIQIYNSFIEKNNRGDFWFSFLNIPENGGILYIKESLEQKLLGHTVNSDTVILPNNYSQRICESRIFDETCGKKIIRNILDWIKVLKRDNVSSIRARAVLDNISMYVFSPKRSLITKFKDCISNLENQVNNLE